MILTPARSADEIRKLAHAIDVLARSLDRLWPKLPLDAMKRLGALPALEAIDNTLVRRLEAIAEVMDACAAIEAEQGFKSDTCVGFSAAS